jgi:hypothetical protein
MQIVRRSLNRGEFDPELLVLAVSVGGVLFAGLWLKLGLPWPLCWFHQLTGEPCATCGATRSAIGFVRGDWLGSLHWNPLAFIAYCGIAAFDIYALVVLLTRAPRFRILFSDAEKKAMRVLVVLLVLVNWGYLLTHSAMFNS